MGITAKEKINKQLIAMADIKVEKLADEELKKRGVFDWSIWEKEVSKFDHHYSDQEQCYFLEGEVIIETDTGNVEIVKGDFVTFPKGLSCVWDIKKSVKKHYLFG